MTTTEKTAFVNALTAFQACLSGTSGIYRYVGQWIHDVNAESYPDSTLNSECTANRLPGGLRVCNVANLPAGPATNDEAIVTDASATTNGTTVAGGGANRVMVRWNASNWVIV